MFNTGESNYPNTINSACADGTLGTTANCDTTTAYNSVDQITIASTGSSCMTVGSAVTVTAKFYCRNTSQYNSIWYATIVPSSGDATWTNIGASAVCSASGSITRTVTTTLSGSAGLQAIRAEIANGAVSTSCATVASGRYDHDDLLFTVASAPSSFNLLKDGTLAVTGYSTNALYNPGDTSSHTYIVQAADGTHARITAPARMCRRQRRPRRADHHRHYGCERLRAKRHPVNYTAGHRRHQPQLLKDGTVVVTGYTSGATYNPRDTSTHSYLVRANSASCGSTSSACMAGTDANGTPGAPTITGITDVSACAANGITITYTPGSPAGTTY